MSNTRPLFVTATLLASLGAASWLPDTEGPGVFLVILAGLALVALFGADAIPRKPWNISFAGLALALTTLATLRAAEWIVVPAVMMAAGLIVVSISPARSWIGLLLTGLRPVLHMGSVPRFVLESAGLTRKLNPEGTVTILRTGAIAGSLLLVFGGLFASADRAFAQILQQVSPNWDLGLIPARVVIFTFVLTGISVVAITGFKLSQEDPRDGLRFHLRKIGFSEWFVPLLLLNVLFASFVAVQFTVLFGGHDLVLRTAGLTYAEYARQGFFQLLVASALSLAVVWGATMWSATETPKSKMILKVLLGSLCLLTLVILMSSLKRLGLYEETFGYTRARLVGHAVAWWLGGIFAITIVAGAVSSRSWLPRATIAYSVLAMLLFGAINPENLIARENLERAERTGKVDVAYLLSLGPDAVPALIALPPASTLRSCLLWEQQPVLEKESWSDFNWSRHKARIVLAKEPLQPAYCEAIPRTPRMVD